MTSMTGPSAASGPEEMSYGLTQQVEAWLADEVDPTDERELRDLLAAADRDELSDRFSGPLRFGTAGLRGPLRAGPNGMNAAVVRRAAAGLATWLRECGDAGRIVVVGFDARHRSAEFARDSAAILAAAGFDARLLPEPLPTPLLAFAVTHLGAAAGVMVTASHNPPRDNGYKIYAGDGAQITTPADTEIEAAIRAVGSVRDVPLDRGAVREVDVRARYVAAIAALAPSGPRQLRLVYTAMHGVGSSVLREVLVTAGFTEPIVVAAQDRPDPDFPTVAFPNPEEPGALDLAFATAREHGADLIIANDPDADRCAVAVPADDGTWRMLRGDEVGVLLADALLQQGIRGTYATTIVSSAQLGTMAAKHGAGYVETLTGFKWIARAAPDLVYGYEEALGYAVAPHLVRDKDGISAALLVAARAAALQAMGSSLARRLDELADEYGRYATDQVSVRVTDLALIASTMRRLRAEPPATLLGQPIAVDDLLPRADVLRWTADGLRVVVRPSGTEPKLKAYLEVVEPNGSAGEATERLARLRAQLTSLLAGRPPIGGLPAKS